MDVDIDTVLAACDHLLTVDVRRKLCRFSRLSIQEYLETRHWDSSAANGFVAKVCLTLLNDPSYYEIALPEDTGRYLIRRYLIKRDSANRLRHKCNKRWGDDIGGLLRYTSNSWVDHIKGYGDKDEDNRLVALLKRFLGSPDESGPAYRSWHNRAELSSGLDRSTTGRSYSDKVRNLKPAICAPLALCTFGFHRILSEWWALGFANVNQQNGDGIPLLQLASKSGFASVVGELLKKGARVNTQSDGRYKSALQAASGEGHVQVVRLLLDARSDDDIPSGKDLIHSLEHAACEGRVEVVQLLLEHGADNVMQGHDRFGEALHRAARKNRIEVLRLLIGSGADIYMRTRVSVESHGYGVQRDMFTVLGVAVQYGEIETVRFLLDAGADSTVCEENGSMLQIASRRKNSELIQLLLEGGAVFNAQVGDDKETALVAALHNYVMNRGSSWDDVQQILDKEAGSDVSSIHGTTLQIAMEYKSLGIEVLQLLLKNGADVNEKVGEWGTALQKACFHNKEEIIQLLLENGVNVNAETGVFGTALQTACFHNKIKIVQLLLENGANVNAEGGEVNTAL